MRRAKIIRVLFQRFQQKNQNVQDRRFLCSEMGHDPKVAGVGEHLPYFLGTPAHPAVSMFPNTPVKRSTHAPPSCAMIKDTSSRFHVRVEFATTSHLACLYEVRFKP